MPILFNFHILLATFYIIFGTNILIQCPVPVPVYCMFFVSQKPNIKRSPNGIKTDKDFFWNIYDFWEVKSTRNSVRGGHETGGHVPGRHCLLLKSVTFVAACVTDVFTKVSPQEACKLFADIVRF